MILAGRETVCLVMNQKLSRDSVRLFPTPSVSRGPGA
jgi:hypothetical protein